MSKTIKKYILLCIKLKYFLYSLYNFLCVLFSTCISLNKFLKKKTNLKAKVFKIVKSILTAFILLFFRVLKMYIFSYLLVCFLTLILDILNSLINPQKLPSPEFMMEVTNKTNADVKVSYLMSLLVTFIIMFCYFVIKLNGN